MLGVAGAWAIGVWAGANDRLVQRAILAAAFINAFVAIGESFGIHVLPLKEGRPTGLVGHPAFLAMFLAAAFWLVAVRFRDKPTVWGAGAVVFVAVLQLAGSPLALVLVAGTIAIRFRSLGRRLGATLVLLAVAGLLLGSAIAAVSSVESASHRLETQFSQNVDPRLDTWLAARLMPLPTDRYWVPAPTVTWPLWVHTALEPSRVHPWACSTTPMTCSLSTWSRLGSLASLCSSG